jgi:c-di-GMP-binding flagellar brake protein YcgR
MEIKRIYVRVPLSGEAILSNGSNPTIKARIIDISQGGVAVVTFLSEELATAAEYQIDILTEAGQRIEIFAQLVRVDDSIAGFQTLRIDQKSLEVINDMVSEYQTTTDFIKQLDEFNLLDDKVVDEEGNEFEITFEKSDSNGNT